MALGDGARLGREHPPHQTLPHNCRVDLSLPVRAQVVTMATRSGGGGGLATVTEIVEEVVEVRALGAGRGTSEDESS